MQNHGLPMGSAVSPLYANIYKDNLEESTCSLNNKVIKHVFTWIRYVDNIFCIWTGTERQADNISRFLNSFNENIQFTIELGHNSLNFLDRTVKIESNY